MQRKFSKITFFENSTKITQKYKIKEHLTKVFTKTNKNVRLFRKFQNVLPTILYLKIYKLLI